MHAGDRHRDLAADEVGKIPEVAELPDGSRVLYTRSWDTYDGTRYDGIDPSALHDALFVCPQPFPDVASWLERRLSTLGWPAGRDIKSAPSGDFRTEWRRWSRGKKRST